MKNGNLSTQHAQRIAFVHHKGGTGKTTSCLNIGGWLSKMGKSVLILDMDPQANATAGLGVDLSSVQASMADVLFGHEDPENTILETRSGLYLIPAALGLRDAEIHLARQLSPMSLLKDKITGLDKKFNYLLFDAPPGSGLLMMNSIVAAENLIIPLDAGIFGFEALATLKALLLDIQKNFGIDINIMMAVLKNFSSSLFDRRFTKNIKTWTEEFFAANELESCRVCSIPFSKKIYQAQYSGLPISHYAPFAKVARAYRQIAQEIIGDHSK